MLPVSISRYMAMSATLIFFFFFVVIQWVLQGLRKNSTRVAFNARDIRIAAMGHQWKCPLFQAFQ
jgi:hypothetical protein